MDSFENLNIEGILDEALKLDEQEAIPTTPPTTRPPTENSYGLSSEDESMFSGLLDEALGASETESILGGATKPASNRQAIGGDPMSDIEAELLGERLKPVSSENIGSNLSELVKTRISIPTERVTTNRPVRGPRSIEVPLTIEVEDGEKDIELLLKIRLLHK